MEQKQFVLNPSQQRLTSLVWNDPHAENILAYGPSRSGKTACLVASIVNRAIMYPNTNHAIFRRTRRSCMSHIFNDTFPKIIGLLFPGYLDHPGVKVNRQDGTVIFHTGSKLVFDGLDPNNLDRVLGAEYATAYINECNEITDYEMIQQLASRMANKGIYTNPKTGLPILDANGREQESRALMLFDCNPDLKSDWDHRCFVDKVHPTTGKPFKSPDKWRRCFVPSKDNEGNLTTGYLESLAERYDGSPAMEERFLNGMWRADNPNALFRKAMFTYCEEKPTDFFSRIVVGVDPSGGEGNNSDYTGIVVVGLGLDDKAYVLEDGSVQGLSSEKWAAEVVRLYDFWKADTIVAEKNYGGDMVRTTIKSARRNLEPVLVSASRSKIVRAEPVAQQYLKKRVVHMGDFKLLEAQMCDYKPNTKKSPDRMDALVWALTNLLDLNGEERERMLGYTAFKTTRLR